MKRTKRDFFTAVLFLMPNLLLFAVFVAFPLFFSLYMAFSNWELSLHNRFTGASPDFVWLGNFAELLTSSDFWYYLYNTVFLMLSIPVSIAGSLFLAVMLSRPLKPESKITGLVLAFFSLVFSLAMGFYMLSAGLGTLAFIFCVVAGAILALGFTTGSVVYRTLFYLPFITSGVAIFLLWKQMYNPRYGPVNRVLAPVLETLSQTVNSSPQLLWNTGGYLLILGGFAAFVVLGVITVKNWTVGEYSLTTGVASLVSLAIFTTIVMGLGVVVLRLPEMASDGLRPPNWLSSVRWAKPALVIMAIWIAVGGNNMLLYLAGISNISPQLYEAADIDGAGRWQKFQHVTWPQLAPTTFFIVVMSVIGGLQGGFNQVMAMTGGGPYGATTTLSFFLYEEGFETGRLGYGSAVAWIMFALVFIMTLINFKMGSKHVSE